MRGLSGERFCLHNLSSVAFIVLLTSFAAALINSIWAVYIESIVHSEAYVGFITSALAGISLITYLLIIPFIEKINKIKLFTAALVLSGLTYFAYGYINNIYIFLALAVLSAVIGVTYSISRGEIVRNQTVIRNIGKIESFVYATANFSWIAGALVAGLLSNNLGIKYVFFLAAAFLFFGAIGAWAIKLKKVPLAKRVHSNLFANIKAFLKNKGIRRAYFLGMGIDFWWGLVYTFVPLFIIRQANLSVVWVGVFIAALSIPLVLLEYYFGKLGDKKGFRILFIGGYTGLAIAALLCFLISNIYAIMGLIILASVCAAMVEPTSEANFFKYVPVNNQDKFYSIYHTAVPLSGFISKALGAVILLLLPWNYVFLGFGLIIGVFAISAVVFR